MADQRAALEALLQDPNFLELSSRTKELNLFEAIDMTRREIRHSAFLAFLLDPDQPHGLGGAFLEGFLAAIAEAQDLDRPFTGLQLRLMDFDAVNVETEFRRIDVLVHDQENKWVCAIENKVQASEHGDQLARYKATVERQFPDHDQLLLYLTPEGEAPSVGDYVPVTYRTVLDVLDTTRKQRSDHLEAKAEAVMEDYAQIIRRHVIMEGEIAELCRKVYWKHKEAIDLVNEHKPSIVDLLQERAPGIVEDLCEDHDFVLGTPSVKQTKAWYRFWPRDWDVEGLKVAEDWTESDQILAFELCVASDEVTLDLVLGPGEDKLRSDIYGWLREQERPFQEPRGGEPSRHQRLYKERLVSRDRLEETLREEGEEAMPRVVDEELRERIDLDLPRIAGAISQSSWFRKLDSGTR